MTFTDDGGFIRDDDISFTEGWKETEGGETDNTGTSMNVAEWKPRSETTYETMTLTRT